MSGKGKQVSKIKTGSPVILKDASGLKDFGHFDGQLGWANSITTVPGDKSYVFFMPEDSKEMTVVDLDRLEYDESRDGLELDSNTIYKGE